MKIPEITQNPEIESEALLESDWRQNRKKLVYIDQQFPELINILVSPYSFPTLGN
jgi:hypothetical protein